MGAAALAILYMVLGQPFSYRVFIMTDLDRVRWGESQPFCRDVFCGPKAGLHVFWFCSCVVGGCNNHTCSLQLLFCSFSLGDCKNSQLFATIPKSCDNGRTGLKRTHRRITQVATYYLGLFGRGFLHGSPLEASDATRRVLPQMRPLEWWSFWFPFRTTSNKETTTHPRMNEPRPILIGPQIPGTLKVP